MSLPAPYDGVAVALPVTLPPVRYSEDTAQAWIARALRQLCTQAGLRPAELDGLAVASFSLAPDSAVALTQHLGLSPRWLDQIVSAGASGVTALRRAARAVQCGDAARVACVAGDENRVESFRHLLGQFSRFAQDASYPLGGGGPNMAFALLTDAYMAAHGTSRAEFGHIAVAQRANACATPGAILQKPLSLQDYLDARMISDPLGLFDCVMPVAGAEAFLVCRVAEAEAKGWPYATLRATIERTNAWPDDPIQTRGGWAMDAETLWAMADRTPADMDVVQTYDDYPVIVALQIEDLGFCAKGEGAAFLAGRDLTWQGDFPMNTSGGQLSFGQAGAAGGFLGLTEALRQLTARAAAQVSGARHALVSGFGMINYDRGLASAAAILAAP